MNKGRGLMRGVFQVMEDYKRKYSEVSEKLMERNKQYQKLQGLYDSLRLRNMVVSAGERDMLLQPGHMHFRGGKTLSLCVFGQNTEKISRDVTLGALKEAQY